MHLVTEKHNDVVEQLVEQFGIPLSTARELLRDWQRGRNLRLEKALRDQSAVAAQNAEENHRGVEGVGQCARRLADSLRLEILSIYGPDALSDDRFMDRLDRENHFGFKPHYQQKARIIHPGF